MVARHGVAVGPAPARRRERPASRAALTPYRKPGRTRTGASRLPRVPRASVLTDGTGIPALTVASGQGRYPRSRPFPRAPAVGRRAGVVAASPRT